MKKRALSLQRRSKRLLNSIRWAGQRAALACRLE